MREGGLHGGAGWKTGLGGGEWTDMLSVFPAEGAACAEAVVGLRAVVQPTGIRSLCLNSGSATAQPRDLGQASSYGEMVSPSTTED